MKSNTSKIIIIGTGFGGLPPAKALSAKVQMFF
jgi:NADH dehydrogenase FAD-containing subunit